MKESVGVIIIAKNTNNFLLLHRVTKPIVWSVLTGKMEKKDKNPLMTIKREIEEEINIDVNIIKGIELLGSVHSDDNLFHLFVGFVDEEFTPNLKLDENDKFGWYNEDNLPKKMHKRWPKTYELVKPILYLRNKFLKHTKNI